MIRKSLINTVQQTVLFYHFLFTGDSFVVTITVDSFLMRRSRVAMVLQLLRKNVFPFLLLSMILFLSYHIMYSKSGLLVKLSLSQKIMQAQSHLNAVQNLCEKKEHSISLLKMDNLDLDLLEEQARLLFNVKEKNEILISE